MSDGKAIGSAKVSLPGTGRRKWLQRKFLYTTMLGALIGAIPTGLDYYKAFVYDIEFGHVKHAEEQRRLWVKNFACAQNISYKQVRTAEDILVQVGACANGDVLIEVAPPSGNRILEWISLERLQTASAVSSLSPISVAQAGLATTIAPRGKTPAGTRVAQSPAVKCQKMLGGTKIVRVVQENGTCYREEILVMKGKVVNRKQVPCNTPCG